MSEVVVHLGPARSGKTHELVRQYRDVLCRLSAWLGDRALWLAPNARAAADVRGQLLADGLDACLRPGIVTFDELTALIVTDTGALPRPITPPLQRELLRRVIHTEIAQVKLEFFADAASRPGFIDLLAEHVRELKRHDIRPTAYAKARAPRGAAPQHSELARLYTAYERLLSSHGLRDRESEQWAARDALAAGACRRFDDLELIVVDGFTDFTRTQHDILRLLAQRAKRLAISLPGDAVGWAPPTTSAARNEGGQCPPYTRPDLFAKVRATLAELRRHHPQLEVRRSAPRPSGWAALDHLAGHIFGHPGQLPPPPAEALESLDGRLEIIEAAGAQDEIVQIARRIKHLLTEKGTGPFLPEQLSPAKPPQAKMDLSPFPAHARPGDIVVVFRSLADAAPRVREVFEQFGIPCSVESGEKIAGAAVVRTLLALLRLEAENWPFRRVVSVLTNNTLSAVDSGTRQAADWLVRELQIAQGRDKLLQRVQQLAEDRTPPDERSEHYERRVTAAAAAWSGLRLLRDALDALPQEATPTEWCAALARLGATLGLPPFNDGWHALRLGEGRGEFQPAPRPSQTQGVPPEREATDIAAWQCIVEHFAALERLDAWLGQPVRRWSRRDLLHMLVDIGSHELLPWPNDDVGRVRVLAGPTARTVAAEHLFLAGMSEQAFPSPERAGRLASDAEYRSFARQSEAATRSQDEMLLFYEVLTRSGQTLTISYPALDDKAQVLPPSPYVTEIERTLGEENTGRIRRTKPQLSPVPRSFGIYSPADWRVQAIAQALDGDRHLLAGLVASQTTRPLGEALEAGVRIIHARARGDFGPAEGLLASPAALSRLAQRFGPQHTWSPSQWERYAACPYKFFLEDVLRLAPLGDLVLETDYRRRGSLLHDVLAGFHRRFNDAPAEAWAELQRDAEQFVAELKNTLQAAIDATPRDGIEAALVELDRRQIDGWIARYRQQHEKYDGAWSKLDQPMLPAHFELRFGRQRPGHAGEEDPRSTDDAFLLDIGGEQVVVAGRIDRIDVGRAGEQTVFNVIDYKSGKRPSLTRQKIAAGERLQPALYVMAAQALVFGDEATPMWAGYWSMQGGVTTDGKYSLVCSADGAAPSDDWQTLRGEVVARVGQFVQAIRGGAFPVFNPDQNCTSLCEFSTVCRVGQIRSLGKIWPPDDAACGL